MSRTRLQKTNEMNASPRLPARRDDHTGNAKEEKHHREDPKDRFGRWRRSGWLGRSDDLSHGRSLTIGPVVGAATATPRTVGRVDGFVSWVLPGRVAAPPAASVSTPAAWWSSRSDIDVPFSYRCRGEALPEPCQFGHALLVPEKSPRRSRVLDEAIAVRVAEPFYVLGQGDEKLPSTPATPPAHVRWCSVRVIAAHGPREPARPPTGPARRRPRDPCASRSRAPGCVGSRDPRTRRGRRNRRRHPRA